MTTKELLAEVAHRGLKITLEDDGHPHLRGDRSQMTIPLLKVLHWHRERIIQELREQQAKHQQEQAVSS